MISAKNTHGIIEATQVAAHSTVSSRSYKASSPA